MPLFLSLLAAAAAPIPPRPEMPQLTVTEAAACDNPAERKRIMTGDAVQSINPEIASKYNADWKAYLEARMAQIGMTDAERQDFGIAMLASKEFGALQQENNALFEELKGDLTQIQAATDEIAACKLLAHMTTLAPKMLVNAQSQYALMDRDLDAVAAKHAK